MGGALHAHNFGDPLSASPPRVCVLGQAARLKTILKQRDKLIKEGKYTPPDYHKGKEEPRP